MSTVWQRSLEDLRPVLLDPECPGPEVVYTVTSDFDPSGAWKNKTEIAPGLLGREFLKTFGHYHGKHVDEIYAGVSGQGILLLQKKVVRDGRWVDDEVSEVLLVTARQGDRLTIKPEYGHSWSNTGSGPLLLFDNWASGHQEEDYRYIRKLHGMTYYLTKEGNDVVPVPNPNYKNLPKPIFLTAKEFSQR